MSTRWVVALVLAAGCGGKTGETGEGHFATEPRTVTLVAPGDEPRRQLAYAMTAPRHDAKVTLAVGDRQHSALAFRATLRWQRRGDGYTLAVADLVPQRHATMQDDEWALVRSIYEGFEDVTASVRASAAGGGRECRDFRVLADLEGEADQVEGTACRRPDGRWEMISG
jgi:hypothetical protein